MKRVLTTLALAAVTLTACGDDGADTPSAATAAETTGTSEGGGTSEASDISVEGIWARTSAANQTTGAAYFEITSAADDVLVGASVPAEVAATVEIHEVVPADDSGDMSEMSGDSMSEMSGDSMSEGSGDSMSEMSDDHEMSGMDMGAMVMRELTDGLPLPAGETVVLQPGGYHVMLLDLAEPLVSGDTFELTLEFANAAPMTIPVTVSETAP